MEAAIAGLLLEHERTQVRKQRVDRLKPVLLLDIDGVLNALGIFSDEYEAAEFEAIFVGMERFTLRVPNGTRDRIARLLEVFDLVWCTAWQEHAHPTFREHLGLETTCPHIEMVGWNGMLTEGINWKWPWVREWADREQRPFAWLDDDFGPTDIAFAAERIAVPHLIEKVPATKGLGEAQVHRLLAWAEQLA